MSVFKTVFFSTGLAIATEKYAFANAGVDFPGGLLMALVVIGVPYLLLYLLVSSIWRTYKERKEHRFTPLINFKIIALSSPLVIGFIILIVLGGLEGLNALYNLTLIVVLFGGGFHYLLWKLFADKDRNKKPLQMGPSAPVATQSTVETTVVPSLVGSSESLAPKLKPRSLFKTAGIVLGLFLLPAVIYFASIPHVGYRMKAYNAAAFADLRNARVSIEAYCADHKGAYPGNLSKTYFVPSRNVDVQYVKNARQQYTLTSSHMNGDKEYKCTSDDSAVYWRDKNDLNATWQLM